MLAQLDKFQIPRIAQRNDGFITAAVPQQLVDDIATVAKNENTSKSEIIRVAFSFFLQSYYQSAGNSITDEGESSTADVEAQR